MEIEIGNKPQKTVIDEKYGFDPSYLRPPRWHTDIKHTRKNILFGSFKYF